ncbi:OPT2 Oligopeptide transporter 2 [Candida maltosa Xu316]
MGKKEPEPLTNEHIFGAITSIGSYHDVRDHEINIQERSLIAYTLSKVAITLSESQKWFVLKRLHFDHLVTYKDLPLNIAFIFEKLESVDTKESVSILKRAIREHATDVNLPEKDMSLWKDLVAYKGPKKTDLFCYLPEEEYRNDGTNKSITNLSQRLSVDYEKRETAMNDDEESLRGGDGYHDIVDWDLQVRLEAVIISYWSPYPEVRAITYPFDDPTIPVETFRVYLIGIMWTVIGAVMNQSFAEHRTAVLITMPVIQFFLYPFGVFCEWGLPEWKFKIWKYTININPGIFNFKEMMLATIFCNITGNVTSYAATNILMQKSELFYNNQWADFGYQVLLIFSSNLLGVGLAGLMRKFVVYPVKAMWPSILPGIALNRTMVTYAKRENINGWSISAYSFFFSVFGISFFYFWIPDYLFTAVSQFNWMTWIKPDNLNLAAVTGSIGGLGLNPVPTFDWKHISLLLQPLQVPLYNPVNNIIGMFIGFFCIIGVWYSNYKWTGFLPINSKQVFTNTGEPYSLKSILTNNNSNSIDRTRFKQMGAPFYSAGNLVVYGAYYAIYPFHIVYEFAIHYQDMWHACKSYWRLARDPRRSTYDGYYDPHSTMMKAYPEVPEWVYLIVLIIALVLAIICVQIYPADTPVWTIFFILAISVIFLIPLTTILARTGFTFGISVLLELIIGYAIPGNGLAMAFTKLLSTTVTDQAQKFSNDLKQGHYAKLPPWSVFRVQIVSIIISSFVQLGMLHYQMNGGIKDYCDPSNSQNFTCPNANSLFTDSVVWGIIGPREMLDHLYPILKWCFLIGFLLAFPCIAIKKWGPWNLVKYFEPSVVIGGFLNYAPYNLSYYIPGLYVAFAFMYYVRKRYEAWWSKYIYLLSTGLNASVGLSGIIIFFAVMYHEKKLDWWGNSVSYKGYDGNMTGWLNATTDAPDGYFGPRVG